MYAIFFLFIFGTYVSRAPLYTLLYYIIAIASRMNRSMRAVAYAHSAYSMIQRPHEQINAPPPRFFWHIYTNLRNLHNYGIRTSPARRYIYCIQCAIYSNTRQEALGGMKETSACTCKHAWQGRRRSKCLSLSLNHLKSRGICGYNEGQRPLSASELEWIRLAPETARSIVFVLSASAMIRLAAETERDQAKSDNHEA